MKFPKVHGAKSKGRTEEYPADPGFPVMGGFRGTPAWAKIPSLRTPAVDISENDKELTVTAEIPGLSEKDLDLSYLDGVLYLSRRANWRAKAWCGTITAPFNWGRSSTGRRLPPP